MKLFHTGSPDIVKDCQLNFGFLPLGHQIIIRTANFLQKFVATENTVCRLFVDIANAKLKSLFSQYGNNIMTASRLRELIHEQFCNSRS
jgi:hypothetical protein